MLLRSTFLLLADSCQTLQKMQDSICGAILSFSSVLLGLFGGHKLLVHALIFCLLFDLLVEAWASLKAKRFHFTKIMENLITKVVAYFGSLTLVLYIEHGLGLLESGIFDGGILCGLICATELWNILGGMLAINPNIPGLKLLRRFLRGEIAKKLNMSESDLSEVFKDEPVSGNSDKAQANTQSQSNVTATEV